MEDEIVYYVYDREDHYRQGECHEVFYDEDEARDFVVTENSAYGYDRFYYISSDK